MKRLLCVIALAALVMLPDWASACWRRSGRPVYQRYYQPVAYRAPVYYAAAPVYHYPPAYCQPVYVQPCPPVMQQPLQPPRIVPAPPMTRAAPIEPLPGVARPEAAPPRDEPIAPAGGIEAPKVLPIKPAPDPAPEPKRNPPEVPPVKTDAKPPISVAPKEDEPKTPAKAVAPKFGGNEAKLPPLEIPSNDAKAKLPPLELPAGEPMAPAAEPMGGTAVPVPAPAPDVLVPPADTPAKNPDSLPPLTLPPDAPIAPREVEAKSSPLRALDVRVIVATGSKSANGLRKIGFYNHTKRDLALTIEGKNVTLPAMSYLHANLPPTFTWKCPDKPAAEETVPADAAGVDVVIRE